MWKKNNNRKISDMEYVDLGLPSGLLWATCNLGANNPTDVGYYFQWGDARGYSTSEVGQRMSFNRHSYCLYDNEGLQYTKYNRDGGGEVLRFDDDAAALMLGDGWYIPSVWDFDELLSNTDVFIVSDTGEEIPATDLNYNPYNGDLISLHCPQLEKSFGLRLKKKGDHSVSLFLPNNGIAVNDKIIRQDFSGNYLTSMQSNSTKDTFYGLVIDTLDGYITIKQYMRESGLAIRAVKCADDSNDTDEFESDDDDKILPLRNFIINRLSEYTNLDNLKDKLLADISGNPDLGVYTMSEINKELDGVFNSYDYKEQANLLKQKNTLEEKYLGKVIVSYEKAGCDELNPSGSQVVRLFRIDKIDVCNYPDADGTLSFKGLEYTLGQYTDGEKSNVSYDLMSDYKMEYDMDDILDSENNLLSPWKLDTEESKLLHTLEIRMDMMFSKLKYGYLNLK